MLEPFVYETDADVEDVICYAQEHLKQALRALGNEGMAVQECLLKARERIQQLLDWYEGE